jgi:hypothetical protein
VKDCKAKTKNFIDNWKNRSFIWNNRKVTIFICGELSILKNKKDNSPDVSLRCNELRNDFDDEVKKTNIFLNPGHTPFTGYAHHFTNRMKYLSKNNKCFVHTSNGKSTLSQQYFIDGKKQLKNNDCEINPIKIN